MHLYERLLADFLRKERGDETVRAFARKVGLTYGTLHRIENLQQSVTLGKLGEIMDRLGCSWEDIFGKAKLVRTEKTVKISSLQKRRAPSK